MNMHDFFHLNIKPEHIKREDHLIDKAIEYLNVLSSILSKKFPETTYQTVLQTIQNPQKLLEALLFGISGKDSDPDTIAAKKMLLDLTKANNFDYSRFKFVICGIERRLMPKTKASANISNIEDALYLGFFPDDAHAQPTYLPLGKGHNILLNLDELSPNALTLRLSINGKLSHQQGAIIIDQGEQKFSESFIKEALKLYDRKGDCIKTDNFDFDIKKAILEKQIVHVQLKRSQVKKSKEMLDNFSEKLLETLAELPENNTPFNIVTFDCERSLSDRWLDMLNQLESQKQWVNTYIATHQPQLLPPRYFSEVTYQLIAKSPFDARLCQVPFFESLPNFKDALSNLEEHHNIFITKDGFTVLQVGY